MALSWSHAGEFYRVTAWPGPQFERRYGEEWVPVCPDEAALASAAQTCGVASWQSYLDFVPRAVRELVEQFSFARMPALLVALQCPALVADLVDTPALTVFVAAHANLRGTDVPAWAELNAVHERDGIFGVIQWLGLPASRQTLAILRNVAAPDLPRKLLEPLRTSLWEPEAIWAMSHEPVLTDARLQATCHALAA